MKKIFFESLSLEVTRRCNMHCTHCMRGLAEAKDMRPEVLRMLLSQTSGLGEISFTGGEPTLNLPIIEEALNYCKEHKIYVGSFYLVTNGKEITDRFLSLMLQWYAYCVAECKGEAYMCGVALSKDFYHEPIDPRNEMVLRALSFYRPEDKRRSKDAPLINLGNAKLMREVPKMDAFRPEEINVYGAGRRGICVSGDTSITLTVDGELLSNCDYEYSDTSGLYICKAEDASSTFEKILYDPSFNWIAV